MSCGYVCGVVQRGSDVRCGERDEVFERDISYTGCTWSLLDSVSFYLTPLL